MACDIHYSFRERVKLFRGYLTAKGRCPLPQNNFRSTGSGSSSDSATQEKRVALKNTSNQCVGSRMWKNSLQIRFRIQDELWYGSWSRSRQKRYRYWSGSGSSKKGLSNRKIFKKCMKNAHNLPVCFVGVYRYYFTITCLQLIIQISVQKLKLCFQWVLVGSGSV